MPAEDKISSLLDVAAIQQEIASVGTDLGKFKQQFFEFAKTINDFKSKSGGTFSGDQAANSELLKQNNAVLDSEKKLIQIKKEKIALEAAASNAIKAETQAQIAGEKAAQERLKTEKLKNDEQKKNGSKALTIDEAKLAEVTRQANAETRNQAKLLIEADKAAAAGGETIGLLRGTLKELENRRDHKIALFDEKGVQEANTEIAKIKSTIDKIEQGGGNFRGNVGNYTNSIKILKGALTDATAKLTQLTQAGQLNTEQGQKLSTEVTLLTEFVGQQSQGFLSLSREIMNTGKALETLQASGLKGTEAFNLLEQEFVKSKVKLKEFRNEQQLLTQELPKLAALTTFAKGLGGIYAAGAGAAALFGDENGKVQEHLQKLVAIMTILQGLRELNELLLKENAIATILFGQATAVTTIALEGETIAMEETAAASLTFDKALKFIAANPIVLFLTALAGVIVYLISTYKSEEDQLKEVAKASKDYSESIKNQTDLIETENKFLSRTLELQKQKLENDLAEASVVGNQSKILALKGAILAIDSKINDDRQKSHPNLLNDLADEEQAFKKLVATQKEQDAALKQLAARQKKGEKEIGTDPSVELRTKFKLYYVPSDDIKDALTDLNDLKKINDDALKAAESNVNELRGIRDADAELTKRQIEHKAELEKLGQDEKRKLTLASAQIEVSATQDKNALVLSNEHSSFKERIDAMKSNQAAIKRLAAAEKNNIVNDPSVSDNDKLIAEKQYTAKIVKIKKDGAAEILKATEDNNHRVLTAENAAQKSRADIEIRANEEISKNTTLGLDLRITAYGKGLEKQQQLIKDDAALQKKVKVLSSEELIALDAETDSKLLALAEKSKKDISDIFVSSLNQQLSLSESVDKLRLSQQEYTNDISIKNKKKRDEENSKLEYEATQKQLADQIANDAQILLSLEATDEAKLAAQKDYNEKNAAYIKNKGDREKSENDKQDKLDEDLYGKKVAIANSAFDTIKNLEDAAFERQVQQIQTLIDLNNQKKETEIRNIEASTLSAQEKAALITESEAKAAAQNEALQRKQRALRIREAKFDRDASILQITGNAIAAHFKLIAELGPAGIPLAIANDILAALQIAALIAKPLPSFRVGTLNSPEGLAKVHGGEMIVEPSGRSHMTSPGETIEYLKRGSKVITSDEVNQMMMFSMMKQAATHIEPKSENSEIKEAVLQSSQRVVSAIRKIKGTNIIVNNDAGFMAHINQQVKN